MQFIDMPVRIAKRHMKQHQSIIPILDEAFQLIENFRQDQVSLMTKPAGTATILTLDFGRNIGKCECVETTADDEIVYAIRRERDRHMRFVKNREMTETRELTLILFRHTDHWKLVSGWFGGQAAREPQDPNSSPEERAEAYKFWSTHALVWGCQRVRDETITETCPWPIE